MPHASRDHKEGLIEWLRGSPARQRAYLAASVEENADMPAAILDAIREVAEARGFEALAEEAGLSSKALYKILSKEKESKPRFETVSQILHALGLRLTVKPLKKERAG